VRNKQDLPKYTPGKILFWADRHFERTGEWPDEFDGPIIDAPGETWKAVQIALSDGKRGLPGGSSLVRLLAERRGVRNRMDLPPLTARQILTWADAHLKRTGDWPTRKSGRIADAPNEQWNFVDNALRFGKRGFTGGSTLCAVPGSAPKCALCALASPPHDLTNPGVGR